MPFINRRFDLNCPHNQLMKRLSLLVFLLMSVKLIFGQATIKDSVINSTFIGFSYGFQMPGADLAKTFGNNSRINFSAGLKLDHNWMFEVGGNYLFGNDVKIGDSLVQNFSTAEGYLVGINGFTDQVLMNERGFGFDSRMGKIFPLLSPNPNSGIRLMAGVGFVEHKIKIVDLGAQLPQLQNEYVKGYDRLTNGISLHQTLDYVFFDPKRFVNLEFGFDFTEAFTKNRRTWNFDQMQQDIEPKLDLFYGVHLGFYIPFYGTHEDVFYYN